MSVEYEEMYARLWKASVKKENDHTSSAKQRGVDIKDGMAASTKDTLSPRAKQINRMMRMGMSQKDIASVMDTSQQAISQTSQKYGLPRSMDI